jgi:hypothetical protein
MRAESVVSHPIRQLFVAAGLLLLCSGGMAGCQNDATRLSGSIGKVYDLSYETVRVRLYESELAVEYVREDGQIPVKVIVEREGEPLEARVYQLSERGDLLGRVDDRRLPPLEGGTIRLRNFGTEAGAVVEGRFDARLVSGETTFTLQGRFDGSLEVVDGSLGYAFPDTGADVDAGDAGDVGDVGDVRGD